ncbi:hypothetical protein JCM8097_004645 [Rhodosporidiobolus ruineniae]
MWASVLSEPAERQSFHALLDDYFARPPPTSAPSPPSAAPAPTAPRALPPRSTPPAPAPRAPATLVAAPSPKLPPAGPRAPSGLTSSRTTAGGFDASSKKSFTKAVFSSKGPMNREEMAKAAQVGPLAVKTASSKPVAPPPRRTVGGAAADMPQEERVRALYDYEGAEAEDLPVVEGEELVVVEHVSADWLRCRNSSGSTGLVPASYAQAL